MDAVALSGNSLSDGDIIMDLGHRIQNLYKDGGVFQAPVRNLKWNYDTRGAYDPHKVAKGINGYFIKDVTIKGANIRLVL